MLSEVSFLLTELRNRFRHQHQPYTRHSGPTIYTQNYARAPHFDDIDDFLESIDAQETQPVQHSVKPATQAPSVNGDIAMQNYLDDLIG